MHESTGTASLVATEQGDPKQDHFMTVTKVCKEAVKPETAVHL